VQQDDGRPRVLAVAFACDPAGGSEPGAAWGVVRCILPKADVVVLVSETHAPALARWQQAHHDERVAFVPIALPGRWATLVRHAGPLRREARFLAYGAWLSAARSTALALHAERPFAVAIHAAFGSYWLPSPVVDLAIPSVWGPVGGGTTTPPALYRFLGWRGVLGEWEKLVLVTLMSLRPATRRTWRRATIRLAETEATRARLPHALRAATRVVNRAALAIVPPVSAVRRGSYLVFPSALQPRKGPRLAVEALAHTPRGVRLVFVADGPEKAALERLAARLGVADRVEFRGRVPRDDLFALEAGAAAVVFTGLREEGGLALAEAMLIGAPVIVLGHGGARLLAESNTDPSRVAIIESGTADDTARRMGAAMARLSAVPPAATGPYLDQASTIAAIQCALEDAAGSGDSAATSVRHGPPATAR
jgi:glycosyltransferase involved in cell wall biosynthesis